MQDAKERENKADEKAKDAQAKADEHANAAAAGKALATVIKGRASSPGREASEGKKLPIAPHDDELAALAHRLFPD